MFLLAGFIYTAGFLSPCGPDVSPATTLAIIEVESGGNPLAIGDNNLKRSFSPGTTKEAVNLAADLIAQGHSVDLGLMQINSMHLAPMKLSLEDVFDPCGNVQIGTTILAHFYRQHQTNDPALSLFKALSAYNTGRAWKGTDYVNKILAAAGAPYRISFGPLVEPAGRPLSAGKRKSGDAKRDGAVSPFFFSNLSTSLVARKGRTGE